MTERRGFITLPNGRLEYRWIGPAPDDAPTLVLMHGGLGCVDMWNDFPDRLAELGFGVFVFSRPGHGRSDPAALPYPVSFMHDHALQNLGPILDAVDIREAILVGHSDGGSIATIYAGGVHDTRVTALVLLAPHFVTEAMCVARIVQTVADYENGELRQRLEHYHGDNVDIAFRSWSGPWLLPEFLNWSIEAYISRIEVPVLIIQGANDEYGTLRQVEILEHQATCPVETFVLPGCGHFPYKEKQQATVAAVQAFLAEAP